HRSWASLRRLKGVFIRRPEARRSSRLLKQLVKRACEEPGFDVQVVPVTVLVGRAPDKETGIAKILFSEDWEIGGRFRRLLGTVINGRHTFVQFSAPISLRELADEGLGASRSLSKVSRVLRTHFRRVRTAAIGPDLSHRRTLMNAVLRSPAVQQAIADKAAADNIPVEKARSIAEAHLREIAADYNYTFVRIASLALTWIWNRIYDGVEVHHFDRFAERAREHEVIYVPCHRSHMDYLLVSYLLYHNGFVPPHVAAGVNLNLPVVGRFLRMGGAFFLRRSFRAQKLYAAVFNEYLSTILARGTAIEYFVEGTRSRTGRLLPPRAGMLVMTVRGFLRNPQRPIMFQPIYLGYERVVEGASYNEELSGGKKKSESLLGLLLAFRILRRRYGEVHVSFGEPLFLNELLEDQDPDWRQTIEQEGERPRWLNPLIDDLGQRIMTGINACAHVNPINLLATVMLAAPRHALDEEQLCRQLDLWKRLLRKGPVGADVKITDATPAEIIELGMEMDLLVRRAHPLGDILELNDERAVELTYYRNNISHLVATPAMIAACFLNNRSFSIARMKRIGLAVFEFIRPELFMAWDRGDFLNAMEAYVELLKEEGLLTARGERTLARLEGGTDEAHQLRLMGLSLLQTLERYYITIAVL
ncbi:MAG: glycerol-3-phosphate 1-O-acyltransferase PlsB, partial [Xanthomonadales bacterium]|nr:glycerol-3-phosphate 1-O-acyltransferase PlsB [Xanthomonadales bacterium]